MSSQWEGALITQVLKTGDLAKVVRKGITADFFFDEEYRMIWNYIVSHKMSPKLGGNVPSLKYVKSRFNSFEAVKSKDTIETIVERVKDARLFHELRNTMQAVEDKVMDPEEGTAGALKYLQDKTISLSVIGREEEILDVTQDVEEVISDYEHAKETMGVTGLEFPFPQLTKDTHGANEGDLITFLGRPGSMKSWYSFYCAEHWHSVLGKRVLILTKELKPKVIRRRCISIYAGIDYGRLTEGTMNPDQERDFRDDVEAWKEVGPLFVSFVEGTGMDAMSNVQAFVEDVEPDVLVIDGFYFIGERDPQVTAVCTSLLKGFLMKWNIPGLINTQLNQDTEKRGKKAYEDTTGGGYGDSYMQDSDVGVKFRLTKEDRMMKEVVHFPVKIREGVGRAYACHARPGNMLGQKYVLTSEEADVSGPTKSLREAAKGKDIVT